MFEYHGRSLPGMVPISIEADAAAFDRAVPSVSHPY
jgi:hypothetical protein